MSQKHSYTTADYLPFDTATNLVRRLYRDEDYRMSLLVGCGIFFGLRISDLLSLTWSQILNVEDFVIYEKKTGKRRVIRVNRGFQGHIQDCHRVLNIKDDSQPCFLNRYGSVISIQMINRNFKAMRVKYNLKINNFSTHTMRKTWARKIWENENAQGRGEQSLVLLSECLNHSSLAISRKYLGIKQEQIAGVYDSLQF